MTDTYIFIRNTAVFHLSARAELATPLVSRTERARICNFGAPCPYWKPPRWGLTPCQAADSILHDLSSTQWPIKHPCATVDNDCNHNAIDICDDVSNVVDVPEAVGLVLTLYCCRLLTTLVCWQRFGIIKTNPLKQLGSCLWQRTSGEPHQGDPRSLGKILTSSSSPKTRDRLPSCTTIDY